MPRVFVCGATADAYGHGLVCSLNEHTRGDHYDARFNQSFPREPWEQSGAKE